MKGMCCRCFDEEIELVKAPCEEDPTIPAPIGMYHCPDCGAMLLAGSPHPSVCEPCSKLEHPRFDA
jgi:hypothetical protein